jgi:hypothetical protein
METFLPSTQRLALSCVGTPRLRTYCELHLGGSGDASAERARGIEAREPLKPPTRPQKLVSQHLRRPTGARCERYGGGLLMRFAVVREVEGVDGVSQDTLALIGRLPSELQAREYLNLRARPFSSSFQLILSTNYCRTAWASAPPSHPLHRVLEHAATRRRR